MKNRSDFDIMLEAYLKGEDVSLDMLVDTFDETVREKIKEALAEDGVDR